MPHERRTYRRRVTPGGLVPFAVRVGQTNLQVLARRDLSEEARGIVNEARAEVIAYAREDPEFLGALVPRPVSPDAPPLVREMADAATAAGVGPMAAVAGAIAGRVGRRLLALSEEAIVENGGDVFMKCDRRRTVAVYAGESPLSWKLGVEIAPEETPLGIATSSGTVGPSLSFGKADAAVVIADTAALADAVATGLGNRIRVPGDAEPALAWALGIEGVRGALVVIGETVAAQGRLSLVPLDL